MVGKFKIDNEIHYNNKIDHTVKTHDEKTHCTLVKLFSGDCYISSCETEILVTILGSCISACIRDPIARVGGMNHFLLPDTLNGDVTIDHDDAARYGAFAMEKLINGLIQRGARKERLEIKLFGGGNVIENSSLIGQKNVTFIKEYLKAEGYKSKSEDLGGKSPRKIHYFPNTGKVMLRSMPVAAEVKALNKEEIEYAKSLILDPIEGDTELF